MSMELILKDVQVTIPQQIENLEQLKTELAPKLEYYNNLVVTEDSIKDAKSDKAKLNKLKTAVEDRRKDIKKQVMGLYEPLEKQCKELTSLIDAPILAIDKQIKAFDEIKKQEKFEELKTFFKKISCLSFVKLEDVLNPKWGNSTSKLDKLKEEVSERVQRLTDDYSEIKKLYENSPMLTAVVQKFEETKDKAHTLAYAAMLEKQYQADQKQKQQVGIINKSADLLPEDVKVTEPIQQTAEPILSGTFKVTCSRSQLIALRNYMNDNDIQFEIVK